MILQAGERHREQIAHLWNKAFGDDLKSVNKYLEVLLEYFMVYEEYGNVRGMLAVLPVNAGEKIGGYVYAVTTHPDYRGQGICSKLIEYVKKNPKYEFLVLVPQNKELFDFYKKMSFIEVPLLKQEECSVDSSEYSDLRINKISADEYRTLRNSFFGIKNLMSWSSEILRLAQDMYGGEFYRINHSGDNKGFAFLYKENETMVIKEIIDETPQETAEIIGAKLNAKKVKFSFISKESSPTFMVFPNSFSNFYFGIYLD